MRDYSRIVIQVFLSLEPGAQDFILGSLLEHSKSPSSAELTHMYRKFDSVESCLKSAQSILASSLAQQAMQLTGTSETVRTNLQRFADF